MVKRDPPADAYVRLRFLPSHEGGLKRDVQGTSIRATIVVEGVYSSCQIYAQDGVLRLGETYEVPVAFAAPGVVRPLLHPGTGFTLWGGRTVASGVIVRLVDSDTDAPQDQPTSM